MICSMCGQEFKRNSTTITPTLVCKGCRKYFAEQRKYNELLLRIFKNDPSLKTRVAV
ncbi:hypothetical protein ACFL3D_03940 [Candidatus Omnitrophota bacterium]